MMHGAYNVKSFDDLIKLFENFRVKAVSRSNLKNNSEFAYIKNTPNFHQLHKVIPEYVRKRFFVWCYDIWYNLLKQQKKLK